MPAAGKQARADEEQGPPGAVNIGDLKSDDIVIAYVIKVLTVKRLM